MSSQAESGVPIDPNCTPTPPYDDASSCPPAPTPTPTPPKIEEMAQEKTSVPAMSGDESPGAPSFGDFGLYWKQFDRLRAERNHDMVSGLKDTLDNLLIFAALFSAVNAGFLTSSLPLLSPDPAAQMNNLLRLLVLRTDNTTLTSPDLDPPPFSPSSDSIRINQYFSASLTCSLLAAFGALLGQQWLIFYKKRSTGGLEKERWDEQRKLDGTERWHMKGLLEIVLPTLLQVALFIFMVGLISFLGSLSSRVALPNTILALLGAAAFLVTLALALWDPYCPFQTSLAKLLLATFKAPFVVLWVFHDRLPQRLVSFSLDVQGRCRGLRRTPKTTGVMNAEYISRVLDTSEDPIVLRDVAANIPFLQDTESFSCIYRHPSSLLRLTRLERSASTLSEKSIYRHARCHVLVASASANGLQTRGYVDEDLHDVAHSYFNETISSETGSDPLLQLPTTSSIVAVLALEASARWDVRYPNFLRNSVEQSADPTVAVGMASWVLLSSSIYVPSYPLRCLVLKEFGLGVPPEANAKSSALLPRAAHVHRKLENMAKRGAIPSTFFRLASRVISHYRPQSKWTQPLVIAVLRGMTKLLRTKEIEAPTSSLAAVVAALGRVFAAEPPRETFSRPLWEEASAASVGVIHAIFEYKPRWYLEGGTPAPGASTPTVISSLTLYALHLARHHQDDIPSGVQIPDAFWSHVLMLRQARLGSLAADPGTLDRFFHACSELEECIRADSDILNDLEKLDAGSTADVESALPAALEQMADKPQLPPRPTSVISM